MLLCGFLRVSRGFLSGGLGFSLRFPAPLDGLGDSAATLRAESALLAGRTLCRLCGGWPSALGACRCVRTDQHCSRLAQDSDFTID